MSQSPSAEAIFGQLTVEMRGFVLGATLLGLDEAGPPHLAARAAEACAAAIAALARMSRAGKSARLGQLARELGSSFPPGLELVHESWIREALAAEPSDLLANLVAGAPPKVRAAGNQLLVSRAEEDPPAPLVLAAELATEMRRSAFEALTAAIEHVGTAVAPWFDLSPPQLLMEVRRLGARSLGASLAAAPMDVRARAMAAVGARFAADLRAAAESCEQVERADGESDVKDAAGTIGGTVEERLEQMGMSALQRRLHGENTEVRRALALRLPLRLGRRLLPPRTLLDPV